MEEAEIETQSDRKAQIWRDGKREMERKRKEQFDCFSPCRKSNIFFSNVPQNSLVRN